MKKQIVKKCNEIFKEREWIVGYKESQNVIKNNDYGITLIALVISIIILLILSGISISMISGENTILKQAGNARTQTDIAGEKEILQTSALAAISKEKYGDLTKEKLDDELNKYSEIQSTEQVNDGIVVTFKSNRVYIVNFNGDVSRYYDIAIDNLVIKDGDNELAENCKSVTPGKSLTINFNATMPNGTIKSITPNLAYTTTGSTTETFTIIGITSEGKEITKKYTINLKGYYDLPNLKVGDWIKYELSAIDNSKVATLNNDVNTYSGESSTQTISRTGTVTENGKEYLLCRVLEMDSNGNPTKLISANEVNVLKLNGEDGYNNAVYLINEMCETLYSGNHGTTRSLTIEDLENNYFSNVAISKRDGSSGQVGYGNTRYYSGNNAKYPNIATEEAKMGIETTLVDGKNQIRTGGLGLSQQTQTYIGSGDANASTVASTNKGITVTQTYYQMSTGNNTYRSEVLKQIIMNASQGYWLASRGVDTVWGLCYFRVRYINDNFLAGGILYQSNGVPNGYNYSVRPIINLNSEIQAEYSEKYNDTYNIWNIK